MSYETDLTAAKKTKRAWGCTCGADNPATYDACHDCQRPSWTCAACGTVNTCGRSDCGECENTMPAELLGDRAEGFEMTWEEWIATQIGPRRVGGRYDHGYDGSAYEVLAIDPGPRPLGTWPVWQITVRFDKDDRTTEHCTGWDARCDRVVAQPPADVTIVSIGRLHDGQDHPHADILQRATIALDLRFAFRDPHINPGLRGLTAHDQAVRDTVMDTPGVREVVAATALQIKGYLHGPTPAPLMVVTQCAGGRHRAATTAMALASVVSGDVDQAREYGLAVSAQAFTQRRLTVELIHRDLDRPVVDR
jgi:hypothetical protein